MQFGSKVTSKIKKESQRLYPERGLAGLKNSFIQLVPAFVVLWLLRNVLWIKKSLLVRESTKFFHLCNRAYGAKSYRKCDRLLVISLRLVANDFPEAYMSLLRESVRSAMINPSRRCDSSDLILLSIIS